MKVHVYLISVTPEDRRDEVRRAFADEDVAIDHEGEASLKFNEFIDLSRIDIALVLAGAVVEGLLYDAEKAAFKRALAAVRRLWSTSGTVSVYGAGERVDYFVPGGPEGDKALAAIEDDTDQKPPPGRRLWVPNRGWVAEADLQEAMRDFDRPERFG